MHIEQGKTCSQDRGFPYAVTKAEAGQTGTVAGALDTLTKRNIKRTLKGAIFRAYGQWCTDFPNAVQKGWTRAERNGDRT